jgi:hypothetical protein
MHEGSFFSTASPNTVLLEFDISDSILVLATFTCVLQSAQLKYFHIVVQLSPSPTSGTLFIL